MNLVLIEDHLLEDIEDITNTTLSEIVISLLIYFHKINTNLTTKVREMICQLIGVEENFIFVFVPVKYTDRMISKIK